MKRWLVAGILLITLLTVILTAETAEAACPPTCPTCNNGVWEQALGEVCDSTDPNNDGCDTGLDCKADCTACYDPTPCNRNCHCDADEDEDWCDDCVDDDNDGIADTYPECDRCAGTPAGYTVYQTGTYKGCSCSQRYGSSSCGTLDCDYLDEYCYNYDDVPKYCANTAPGECTVGTCNQGAPRNDGLDCTDQCANPPCCSSGDCVCSGGDCVDSNNHAPAIGSHTITSEGLVIDGENTIVKKGNTVTYASSAGDTDDDLTSWQHTHKTGATQTGSCTGSSCNANTEYTYTTTGSYTARATYTDANSNTATSTKTIIVEEPPTSVTLTANTTTPTTTQDIKYTVTATDTNLKDYKITYGNGADSGWISCTSSSCTKTYRYTTAGNYNTTVQRRDNRNWITTANGPTITVTAPNPAPTLTISHSPTSPKLDQDITVTIAASDTSPGTINTITLKEGSTTLAGPHTCNQQSCTWNPIITFTSTGTKTVTGIAEERQHQAVG